MASFISPVVGSRSKARSVAERRSRSICHCIKAIEPHQDNTRDAEDVDTSWNVLVIEDNPEVGEFSTQLLQELGYRTVLARNAAEALRLLDENPTGFDVVLTDVVMPGMDGVTLGNEIRRRLPTIPVVLNSGYSHVLAPNNQHGFELIQKPYSIDDLSRALRHALAARRARPDKPPSDLWRAAGH